MIGEAPAFMSMLEHVSQAAPLSKPILVIGERGTGKELIANRLHYLSERWGNPFIKLNCAALTESILESELFGHEEGAFTGASRTYIGRFERADEGTLLLDELATIPLRMQEKILRVIEYGEFERVGGSDTINVDVRIVGATNEDLPALARAGKFRPDLLDRLAFDVIPVPPLRERREDIFTLADFFAVNICAEMKRDYFPGFSMRAASSMLTHPWYGNVRELKNTVERSVYRSTEPEDTIREIVFDPFDSPYVVKRDTGDGAAVSQSPGPKKHRLPLDLKAVVSELEIDLVTRAMSGARYKQSEACESLGLSYHQLRALMRKHKLLAELGRARKKKTATRAKRKKKNS